MVFRTESQVTYKVVIFRVSLLKGVKWGGGSCYFNDLQTTTKFYIFLHWKGRYLGVLLSGTFPAFKLSVVEVCYCTSVPTRGMLAL